ncbi:serine hydrolase [Nereida sp. MMG025]|uniref:serine hydrolase domain-containing protein n=1 Tax=Nereida sp. MMG025 TaxID=2909981 RepID=UPI001F2E3483|nr:serine hydrolase [Nereida sp. MMG025]MCF6445631.1 beta-lactamase family protein [Nereida sp. MMG025]
MIGKILRGGLVLAILLGGVAAFNYERINRLLAVTSLFEVDQIVGNFSNMDAAFLHRPLPRGDGPTSVLPQGPQMSLPAGFQSWIEDSAITALVVLQDGALVHESYHLGTTAADRRISWSVAKSYLSALMGVVLAEGAIDSIDDPVTKYAPALKGGAYGGATIKDVLQMSSGVTFDEDYLKFSSDINRMGRVLALGRSMDGFATDLTETFQPAGTAWQYVSIDTHIIGMVIRGATGRSIPDLLSEKIIAPMGLEADPYYLTDGDGTAFVLGGLNLRTRDYARFGQMYLQGGHYNGQQIVPADWVAASTVPSARTRADQTGYGYQWWIPQGADSGEYLARGIYGQYIYIHNPSGTVIAMNSADRGFRQEGVFARHVAMFRAIAKGEQ